MTESALARPFFRPSSQGGVQGGELRGLVGLPGSLFRAFGSQVGSQEAPRRFQDTSQTIQDGLKTAQGAAKSFKIAPRRFSDGPRRTQNRRKSMKNGC